MHWLRKIPTPLRGTNFCTSSARFATSFIRQLNSPECTQIVQNAPKHQFRVQWGGSGAFVAKNSEATCGTNFYTSSARFAPSFVRQSSGPECTQIVQNAPKHQFRVQCGGSDAFIAKNSDAISWHELLNLFGPFCIEFRKATKQSRMHPNSTNAQNVSLGSNGVDLMLSLRKIPMRYRGTNFGSSSAHFAPSFGRQPSGPECTQIV